MKAEQVVEHALSDLCTRDVIQLLDSGEEKQARAVMKMTGMSKTDVDKTVKEHEEMKAEGKEAIERYGKKLYWEFVELGFSGKPLGIEEVHTHIDYDLLSTELQKLIDDLPVVTIDESWDHGFFSDKLDGTQQFYIAIDKETKSIFIIDTQGYEYARYVSFIRNMPNASGDGQLKPESEEGMTQPYEGEGRG
jgi:hypothetical protein